MIIVNILLSIFPSFQLSVTVKLVNGNDYNLELDLAHSIQPSESSYKVLSTKVYIMLHL
jgi:CS domain.